MSLAMVAAVAPLDSVLKPKGELILEVPDSLENARIDLGKHKGQLLTDLPDSYLTWISHRKKGRIALWAPLANKLLHIRHTEVDNAPNKQVVENINGNVHHEFVNSDTGNIHSITGIAHSKTVLLPEEEENHQNAEVNVISCSVEDYSLPRAFFNEDTIRLRNLVESFDSQGADAGDESYRDLIRYCGKSRVVTDGRFIHAHIVNSPRRDNKFLLNLLVEMYGNWGELGNARAVFDGILYKNIFSWNTMLEAYVRNHHSREAIKFFWRMDLEGAKPNKLTFLYVIEAYIHAWISGYTRVVDMVKLLYHRIFDSGFGSDMYLITCFINLCGKCGCLDEAKLAFGSTSSKDVLTWSTVICAFAKNRHFGSALKLYRRMKLEGVKPISNTYLATLDACAAQGDLQTGEAVHAELVEGGFESSTVVGTSLVHFYGVCGSMQRAVSAFVRIIQKDIISWNVLIRAFVENNDLKGALDSFKQMEEQRMQPNIVSFINVLQAVQSVSFGREIHARVVDMGFERDIRVGNCLMDMYVRCDSLGEALEVFEAVEHPNTGSFGAIISGYARIGDSRKALELFQRMQLDGVTPSYGILGDVLYLCSCREMLTEVWKQFLTTSVDYGIPMSKTHYDCIVEWLSADIQLKMAEKTKIK